MENYLLDFIQTLDLNLKAWQKQVGATAELSDLTLSQLQYIEAIGSLSNPTISDIARRLNIAKSSVTAGVNKLVALGYISKERSCEDRRVFHIGLQQAGTNLVLAKQTALQDYEAMIAQALDEAEARQFINTLDKIVQAFKQGAKP
jgi:DNA-binding MarR family transcriptional regulator